LNDFKKRVKEVGIRMAFSEQNLNINQLLKLAQNMRKSDLSFRELQDGSKVAKSSKKLGIVMDSMEESLGLFYREILSQGHSPMDFIAAAYALAEVRNELKLPYVDAVTKHLQLKSDIDKLEEEKKILQVERDEAEEKRNSALKDAEVTRGELIIYLTERDTLMQYDLQPMLVPKVSRFIKNVEELMDDPKSLIDFYAQMNDKEDYVKELKTNIEDEEKRRKQLEEQNNSLENQIKERQEIVKAADILSRADLKINQAKQISDTVKQVAVKHGYNKTQAVERLCNDLEESYDSVLGFKAKLKIISQEYLSKEKLNQELIERNEMLRKDNVEIINTLNTLKRLNYRGVSDTDIINWAKILEENNLDAAFLRREIKKLSGLPELVRNLKNEEIKLRYEIESLNSQVQSLSEHKERSQTELCELQKDLSLNIKDLVAETSNVINTLDVKIFDQKTGFTPTASKIVENTS
jgi:hypothetical protein